MDNKTLEEKILFRIASLKGDVFLRKDFHSLGKYQQTGKALNQLIIQGKLARIGSGIYARMEKSIFSDKNVLCKSIPELAREALNRLGIETFPSTAEKDYNSGKSAQVPTGLTIGIKSRTHRKIGYGGYYIFYEKYPQKQANDTKSVI